MAQLRSGRRPWTFYALAAFFTLFVLFLYGPMSAIYILSFQGPSGGLTFPLNGVSLNWFYALFQQQRTGDIAGSFARSIALALLVLTLTVVISVMAGLAFRRRFFGAGVIFYMAIASLIMPGLLVSLGIGLMFQFLGIKTNWYTSALGAHLTWTLPFGLLIMFAVFSRFDRAYEEAGRDLGASRWAILWTIVLPILLPGMIAVALFGFTLSYDEFPRTSIAVGPSNTLPLEIWNMTTNVTSPALYAIGTVTTAVSFLVIALALGSIALIQRRRTRRVLRAPEGRRLTMAGAGEIQLERVTKRFGPTVAVRGIELAIPHGCYCCLLGPSGCGKTTILRMIAGHEEPSGGRVRIGGDDVTGQAPVRRGTAMMFQSYALFPHMTVLDNVAYNLRMRGVGRAARREQAHAMLARVHLEAFADRMPAQLSGGQQQRVALARALITNPRVLLLDEPLSALDEYLRLQMRGELKRLQRELGITFIHVTHTQLEAIALADLVVVMDQGRIEQAGSAQKIYSEPQTAYVARFMGGQNVLSGKVTTVADGEAILLSAQGDRFALPFAGPGRAGRHAGPLRGPPRSHPAGAARGPRPLGPGQCAHRHGPRDRVSGLLGQGDPGRARLAGLRRQCRRRPLLRRPGRHRRCRAGALGGARHAHPRGRSRPRPRPARRDRPLQPGARPRPGVIRSRPPRLKMTTHRRRRVQRLHGDDCQGGDAQAGRPARGS